MPYRGRFAPSPTGPLHQGSLLAALASFLDARAHGGQWLLRIEDIDPPREVPGAADAILYALDAHGLHWDGSVLYQSNRLDAYDDALDRLRQDGHVFACVCTRATLGPAGNCGERCKPAPGQAQSQRVRLTLSQRFDDFFLGAQLAPDTPGDLVLKRKDGLPAYALAVVVDDAFQGITHVLRGADLLSQTPAQLDLLSMLHAAPPCYGHLPLVLGADGHKLSKQTGAKALDNARATANLSLALRHLGQKHPGHTPDSVRELLDYAIAQWDRAAICATADSWPVYAAQDKT